MLTVMVKCPVTGRNISTGIQLGARGWKRNPQFFAYTHCPLCDVDHEWSAEDVWLLGRREVANTGARNTRTVTSEDEERRREIRSRSYRMEKVVNGNLMIPPAVSGMTEEGRMSTLSHVNQGPYGSNLLECRMATLNLDPDEFARFEPALFRNLQRLCTTCPSPRRCSHDLAEELARSPAEPASRSWLEYCPNAATLNMLSTLNLCANDF